MEINSASFGGHVVADLAVKAEIDANWDPPGTYGHTDCSTSSHWTVRANILCLDVMMMNLERRNSCIENGKFSFLVFIRQDFPLIRFRCQIGPEYIFAFS